MRASLGCPQPRQPEIRYQVAGEKSMAEPIPGSDRMPGQLLREDAGFHAYQVLDNAAPAGNPTG
jgi:hypothetical protein